MSVKEKLESIRLFHSETHLRYCNIFPAVKNANNPVILTEPSSALKIFYFWDLNICCCWGKFCKIYLILMLLARFTRLVEGLISQLRRPGRQETSNSEFSLANYLTKTPPDHLILLKNPPRHLLNLINSTILHLP